MKNSSKTLLLTAFVLFVIGLVFAVFAVFSGADYKHINSFFLRHDRFIEEDIMDSDSFSQEQSLSGSRSITDKSWSYNNSEVRNLDISLGSADISIKTGNSYSVETVNLRKSSVTCVLKNDTLVIDNDRWEPFAGFFAGWNGWRGPKIIVTIPHEAKLENVRIEVGAGNLISGKLDLTCDFVKIEVGAGNFEINSISAEKADISCGMGRVVYKGSINGDSKIECGMGSIDVQIDGRKDSYSFDAEVGLGEISIDSNKIAGIGQHRSDDRKDKHMKIECGMGSVSIKFSKEI